MPSTGITASDVRREMEVRAASIDRIGSGWLTERTPEENQPVAGVRRVTDYRDLRSNQYVSPRPMSRFKIKKQTNLGLHCKQEELPKRQGYRVKFFYNTTLLLEEMYPNYNELEEGTQSTLNMLRKDSAEDVGITLRGSEW